MSEMIVTIYERTESGIGNSVEMPASEAAKACEAKTHWSGFSGGEIPAEWFGSNSRKKANKSNNAEDSGE